MGKSCKELPPSHVFVNNETALLALIFNTLFSLSYSEAILKNRLYSSVVTYLELYVKPAAAAEIVLLSASL